MKHFLQTVFILPVLALALSACNGIGLEKRHDRDTGYKNVLFVCSLGYHNLSRTLESNLEEMFKNDVPGKFDGNVLVIFSHRTARSYDYTTKTNPYLYRVYMENGTLVRDTLKTYPTDCISASAETLSDVLAYVKDLFPSENYGMLFSSHGTGWLPGSYDVNHRTDDYFTTTMQNGRVRPDPYTDETMVKSAGMHVTSSGSKNIYYTIDIGDMAASLPMHFEYIVFDACLMGAVEVAYELRKCTDYLVFSPTEVLSSGYEYKTMLHNLYSHDFHQLSIDTMEKYRSRGTGQTGSSTISMIDCKKTENLAQACKDIIDSHRDGLKDIDRSKTQAYFYNSSKAWFYDLRDIMVNIGADATQLASLDEALNSCVLYKDATEKFMGVKMERVCGMSMYIPIPNSMELNSFYKNLEWNKATGLVN